MIGVNEITSALSRYEELGKQEKKIIDEKQRIRKFVSDFLHEQKINELKIKVDNENYWSCKYQKRRTESVNKDLLFEIVDETNYNRIVEGKETFSLNIRKLKDTSLKLPSDDVINALDKIETPTGVLK